MKEVFILLLQTFKFRFMFVTVHVKNSGRSFWKFLSDIYLLIKQKNLCQIPFFQSIEMNCQLSDILNWCWMIFKFCKRYICFSLFSVLLLFYNIHFPIWSSFDIFFYWILLSTQVLFHEIVSIQYKVWTDSFT